MLQTLDFSAVRINVIIVEQDGHNPEKDEAVRALLLANEFELDERMRGDRAAGKNEWFVNRHFRPFAKPLHSQSCEGMGEASDSLCARGRPLA